MSLWNCTLSATWNARAQELGFGTHRSSVWPWREDKDWGVEEECLTGWKLEGIRWGLKDMGCGRRDGMGYCMEYDNDSKQAQIFVMETVSLSLLV